ncbi:hypothetical protein T12_12016 [Trichinella patagoniensis]|uniref:Uncharacterized protein n=1 Tax=Trichinella patagoniensis TaxID=990121 RepID=A0A0V0YQ72_9BILA|nr:hypothetical protein T12_12016 [Trichinella patagoniensis]
MGEDKYSCLWKTLGVSWNSQEDELTFRPPELPQARTKRPRETSSGHRLQCLIRSAD